jgi:hypothetical protein
MGIRKRSQRHGGPKKGRPPGPAPATLKRAHEVLFLRSLGTLDETILRVINPESAALRGTSQERPSAQRRAVRDELDRYVKRAGLPLTPVDAPLARRELAARRRPHETPRMTGRLYWHKLSGHRLDEWRNEPDDVPQLKSYPAALNRARELEDQAQLVELAVRAGQRLAVPGALLNGEVELVEDDGRRIPITTSVYCELLRRQAAAVRAFGLTLPGAPA